MNAIETFVSGLILSSAEGREPMGYEDAFYAIQNWIREGVEVPKDLTPRKLADLWNAGIDENGEFREMLKIGDRVKVHIMDHVHREEIRTRVYDKVFEIVAGPELAPGILWDGKEGAVSLLVSFSWNVVFENVDNGKMYHCPWNILTPLDAEKYADILPH